MKISNDEIREIFVQNGFKLNSDGDLKEYVYKAAHALIALAQEVELLQWSDSEHYPQAFTGNNADLSYGIFFDKRGWYLDLPDESTIGRFETMDEAKAAANEHNRKRVLSQLKYGGGGMKKTIDTEVVTPEILEALGTVYLCEEKDWPEKACRAILEAAPEVEAVPFWEWLPKTYRDGDQGDDPKFTKYNMEAAFMAGSLYAHPPALPADVLALCNAVEYLACDRPLYEEARFMDMVKRIKEKLGAE